MDAGWMYALIQKRGSGQASGTEGFDRVAFRVEIAPPVYFKFYLAVTGGTWSLGRMDADDVEEMWDRPPSFPNVHYWLGEEWKYQAVERTVTNPQAHIFGGR